MSGNQPGAKKRLRRRMSLHTGRQRHIVITFDSSEAADEWDALLDRDPRAALHQLADMSIRIDFPGNEA